MLPDTQHAMFATLSEILSLAPDIRFGQLMAHLGFLGEDVADHGLGDIDDDELLAIMYRHRDELRARLQGTTIPVAPGVPLSISGSPMSPLTTPTSE